MNKINCEFVVVVTHNFDCHVVTEEMDVKPDRFFNKGDIVVSKHSPRIGYKPHGLWAIQSPSTINEELDTSYHVEYFRKLLESKIGTIKKLKRQYHFECIFSINIETEDVGVGFDLNEWEMDFILSISSRYSCHFIYRENINS